jgi:carboxymethylenebutenolidase
MVELTASDGHKFSAYRADPSGAPKGAVVVLQEIFGVNAHIKKIAEAFAEKGYVAIAPALFDRAKAGVTLGYDDAAAAEGLELANQVGVDGAMADIQAAVEAVKDSGKVAVVGYSWGGYLAYASANRVNGLACAVGYYGDGVENDYLTKRKIPTLLHFGESDTIIPFEEVVQFRANRPDVSAFSYPGVGHGFNCDDRDGYNAEASQAALERTLFWISQFVEGQAPILLKNAGAYAQAKTEKKKKKKEGGDDMGPPMD